MKLQEGTVFTGVCLSTGYVWSHVLFGGVVGISGTGVVGISGRLGMSRGLLLTPSVGSQMVSTHPLQTWDTVDKRYASYWNVVLLKN